jgi:hypothetical protein
MNDHGTRLALGTVPRRPAGRFDGVPMKIDVLSSEIKPNIAAAWRLGAPALAAWAMARLVNRHDARGGYRPPDEVGKEYTRRDGAVGKLGSQTTRKGRLTLPILTRHFAGRGRADIVGLHSTSPDNTSRWAAPDIDHHAEHSPSAESNLAAALAWYERLRHLGFWPLLEDSNGTGSFHLWTLFTEPTATPLAHAFVRWLTADHARHGLPARPECFPKQARVEAGHYGNWLRLPGMHHTRPHCSRVWDGHRWLEGAAAVEFILALTGDSPGLIPAEVRAPDPPTPRPRAAAGERPPPACGTFGLARRIAAYVARLPCLCEGQGRDDVAYHFAAFLVRDIRLDDDAALQWLAQWDAGNSPPKGEARLREVIASAHRYGKAEYGSGLAGPPPRCRDFRVPKWTPRPARQPAWVGGARGKEARP